MHQSNSDKPPVRTRPPRLEVPSTPARVGVELLRRMPSRVATGKVRLNPGKTPSAAIPNRRAFEIFVSPYALRLVLSALAVFGALAGTGNAVAATPELYERACTPAELPLTDCSASEELCGKSPCAATNAAIHNWHQLDHACRTAGLAELPAGTFHVKGSIEAANCKVRGAGSGHTFIVQEDAGSGPENALFSNVATADETIPGSVWLEGFTATAASQATHPRLLLSHAGGNRVHVEDVVAKLFYEALKEETSASWSCGQTCSGGGITVIDSKLYGDNQVVLGWGFRKNFTIRIARSTFGAHGSGAHGSRTGQHHLLYLYPTDTVIDSCEFLNTHNTVGSRAIQVQGGSGQNDGSVTRVTNSKFHEGVRFVMSTHEEQTTYFVGNYVERNSIDSDPQYYGVEARGPTIVRDSLFRGDGGRSMVLSDEGGEFPVVVDSCLFHTVNYSAPVLNVGGTSRAHWDVRSSKFTGAAGFVVYIEADNARFKISDSTIATDHTLAAEGAPKYSSVTLLSGGKSLVVRRTSFSGSAAGIYFRPIHPDSRLEVTDSVFGNRDKTSRSNPLLYTGRCDNLGGPGACFAFGTGNWFAASARRTTGRDWVDAIEEHVHKALEP